MDEQSAITAVGRVIQFAVAPVFLLSAIGAILTVLTNRLSRVVDRGRVVGAHLAEANRDEAAGLQAEIASLGLRVRLIHRAITLCTVTALLVCALIAMMFIGA